jgi:hypothetical protein
MTEARIGRLLPACLHQAISDLLPDRLEYYEEWLDPDAMRDGTIGPAPMTAVLSFLRSEHGSYDDVMDRAGVLAAEWTCAALPAVQRALAARLPRMLRARLALTVVRRIVREIVPASRASSRLKRGQARLDVTASAFCAVRSQQPTPLCRFYAAALVEVLRLYGLDANATIAQCRATGGASCVIDVAIGGDVMHEARAA